MNVRAPHKTSWFDLLERVWVLWLLAIPIRIIGAIWTLFTTLTAILQHPSRFLLGNISAYREGLVFGWKWAAGFFAIGALVLGFSAILAVIALSIPLLWAALFKRRPARVFVAYHHSKQDLVRQMRGALSGTYLILDAIPFDHAPDHDRLLDSIHELISRCEFAICLPGNNPSFVQHEVMACIQRRKALIFVVDWPEGRLPDTAQKSYPVFKTDLVSRDGFALLRQFIRYLHGDWRSTLQLYRTSQRTLPWLQVVHSWLINLVVLVVGLAFVPIFTIGPFLYAAEYFIPTGIRTTMALVMFSGFFALLAVAFSLLPIDILANGVSALVWRRVGIQFVRRKIILGRFAYDLLVSILTPSKVADSSSIFLQDHVLGNEKIIQALWAEPPPAYYEAHQPMLDRDRS